MTKVCRACGSNNISSREVTSEFAPHWGTPFKFQESIDSCGDCQLEGDFETDPTLNNDARFDEAQAAAQVLDAGLLIESLKGKGIRMAHAERALGLPQRTMFRWKNEGITSAAFALLKIVSEYPGLIEVCEENFSDEAKMKFFWNQISSVVRTSTVSSERGASIRDIAFRAGDVVSSREGGLAA